VPRDPSLLAAKLRALVGHQGTATTFPGGAARVDSATRSGWILADDNAARALGPALVWAERHGVDPARLHVIVDDPTTAGTLARRATQFADPPIIETVDADARTTTPARPAPPLDLEQPAPPDDMQFARTLKAAGAEPVVEHGVLVGEVNGLEVARVVDGQLEVGVGKHDRHAQTLVHGDRPMGEALAAAVAFVRRHRTPGAEPHPLNRLARERWLRADLIQHHGDDLRPISSPVERDDLRVDTPAPAASADNRTVYVCSTGIDLDLVPVAADARLGIGEDAHLVLVVPPKDDHPITRRLAARLTKPAEIVTRALD
jgi:hypothetical protein